MRQKHRVVSIKNANNMFAFPFYQIPGGIRSVSMPQRKMPR